MDPGNRPIHRCSECGHPADDPGPAPADSWFCPRRRTPLAVVLVVALGFLVFSLPVTQQLLGRGGTRMTSATSLAEGFVRVTEPVATVGMLRTISQSGDRDGVFDSLTGPPAFPAWDVAPERHELVVGFDESRQGSGRRVFAIGWPAPWVTQTDWTGYRDVVTRDVDPEAVSPYRLHAGVVGAQIFSSSGNRSRLIAIDAIAFSLVLVIGGALTASGAQRLIQRARGAPVTWRARWTARVVGATAVATLVLARTPSSTEPTEHLTVDHAFWPVTANAQPDEPEMFETGLRRTDLRRMDSEGGRRKLAATILEIMPNEIPDSHLLVFKLKAPITQVHDWWWIGTGRYEWAGAGTTTQLLDHDDGSSTPLGFPSAPRVEMRDNYIGALLTSGTEDGVRRFVHLDLAKLALIGLVLWVLHGVTRSIAFGAAWGRARRLRRGGRCVRCGYAGVGKSPGS